MNLNYEDNNPKVIVLILSYNGKHLLDDAISSYVKNDYKYFSVCVIDNGSNDDTKEFVKNKFQEVYLLRLEKNLGYSGGLNEGMRYAFDKQNADYVLVTNNDVVADGKVISELVKTAELKLEIGFVTGKVYYYDIPDKLQTVGKKEHPLLWNGGHIGNGEIDKGQYDEITERYFADDIFMLVKKTLYDKIGGYDTLFQFQCEEFDWQARAKEAGFKIFYTPFAKLWHKDSMTIGKVSAFKAYYDARNPILVILKHKPADFFRKFFWWQFRVGTVRTSLIYLKQLKIKISLKTWQGFFSGLLWGIKNKKLTFKHIF
ncbi:MAG: glycosyltransferase family 2 protein [Ignavibacteriae bacterium]|nr:glycosyltransferase family 2 protein [Ignavibacteriota bacterium]